MKLIGFQKVKDGKYLKNYELRYLNKSGKEKTYEIVSHRELKSIEDLGTSSSGVSIVAVMDQKLLLLKEFRLGVNRDVYNLCAGMIKDGETMEECIARELYEETGLRLKKILKILPPAFAAVSISEILNQIAFVEVEGIPNSINSSDNEEITAAFYDRNEVASLLAQGASFSSRAQIVSYFFSEGKL